MKERSKKKLQETEPAQEVTEGVTAKICEDDAPLPEPPPEKKKERELPDWMLDKTTVNELKFCKYFVEKHPLKCIKGRFYDTAKSESENRPLIMNSSSIPQSVPGCPCL